jgi:hypothetical protein
MDDMGTPGPNHPARRGLDKRSSGQFDNVFSLGAARELKKRTGKGAAVKVTPDSPSMIKHEDEALAIHKDNK